MNSTLGRSERTIDANLGNQGERNALYALVLSIFPGLGQIYAGYLIRGVVLFVILIAVSWAAAIVFMFTTSTVSSLILLAIPAIAFSLIAFDAVYLVLKRKHSYSLKWYNNKWVYLAVLVVLFSTVNPLMDSLIGRHVVRAYLVDSNSMSPGILRHDIVAINKLSKPKRNDIALIEMSRADAGASMTKVIEKQTLRRIIASQGDEVELRGKQVYVNGELQEDTYASYGDQVSPNFYVTEDYRFGPETVPDDSFFVLADARQYSFDSRMFGFVDSEQITGITTKIFWSWNRDKGHFIWGRTAKNIN